MSDPLSSSRYDGDMPALDGRALLFLHIPKAGGTSFIDLLGRRFGPLDILPVGREGSTGVTRSLADAERYPFVRPSSFTSSMALPGEGWYAAENDGKRWFNWTGPGSESWIELGTPEGSEFALRIGVLHALKAETLFELELFVNDAQLKPEVSRDSGGHTIFARVAAHLLRGAGMSNTITLRVPQLSRPCDCDPMAHDSRTLGIAVYQIELVPDRKSPAP